MRHNFLYVSAFFGICYVFGLFSKVKIWISILNVFFSEGVVDVLCQSVWKVLVFITQRVSLAQPKETRISPRLYRR